MPDIPVVRDQVFVSYSHRDTAWVERLEKHMKPLRRANIMKAWIDRDIPLGSKWYKEILDAINHAKVAVLLVSADFWASDFIADEEMPRIIKAAEDGELTIVWLAISRSVAHLTTLKDYQSLNPPNQPLAEMDETEAEGWLIKAVEAMVKILGN